MSDIVICGRGLTGQMQPDLENKTLLECAKTPVLNVLAGKGSVGLIYQPAEITELAAGKKTVQIMSDKDSDMDLNSMAEAAAEALLSQEYEFVSIGLDFSEEVQQEEVSEKIKRIEDFDAMIGQITQRMDASQKTYRMLIILEDTTSDAVLGLHPFLLYDSTRQQRKIGFFNEREAKDSELIIKDCQELRKLLEA